MDDGFQHELGYLLGRITRLNVHLDSIDSELIEAFCKRNSHFIDALSVYVAAERTSLHAVESDSLTTLAISIEPRLVDICEQAAELTAQTEKLIPVQILLLEMQSHFLGYLALFRKMRWMM